MSNRQISTNKERISSPLWKILLGIILFAGIIYLMLWSDTAGANWHVINDLIKEMGWPFVILVIVLVLHTSIGEFLQNLGKSLGRIRQLKIGENFSFTSEEIIEILVDREKLKTGILIAMAEDGIGEEEAGHLERLASPMKNEVQNLSREQKTKVLEETINMALIDGEIQKEEYVRLQEFADLYNKNMHSEDKVDLDTLVMKACYFASKEPPAQLSQIYPRMKAKWEEEKE